MASGEAELREGIPEYGSSSWPAMVKCLDSGVFRDLNSRGSTSLSTLRQGEFTEIGGTTQKVSVGALKLERLLTCEPASPSANWTWCMSRKETTVLDECRK